MFGVGVNIGPGIHGSVVVGGVPGSALWVLADSHIPCPCLVLFRGQLQVAQDGTARVPLSS